MKFKKIIASLLTLLILFSAFPVWAAEKHSSYIWNAFDTVIILTAYTETEQEYNQILAFAEEEFLRLHRIFDPYNAYEGVANLYALNQSAASAPFAPEAELYELLCLIDGWRSTYSEKTNPAMGAVLKLWHTSREETKAVPDEAQLTEASYHCNWEKVVLKNGTVFLEDEQLTLDLGAVAKGYAAGLVAQELREMGCTSFIINAGGNVVAGEAPLDGREAWTIGIEDPQNPSSIQSLIKGKNLAVVTSGDYQRYFEADGVRYHHLIDPVTLYPGSYCHAITVICEDSALADFLSTALFLTPYEEGLTLIEATAGIEAMWTLTDGSIVMSSGFASYIPSSI